MNTYFNSNVIWLQLEYKMATLASTQQILQFRNIATQDSDQLLMYFENFQATKKFTENYLEKYILKQHSVQSQLTLTALQCPRAGKFKIQSLGQNTVHFLGKRNYTNIFLRLSDLYFLLLSTLKWPTSLKEVFSAEIIQRRKVFKRGNYMRKYGIYIQEFIQIGVNKA